MNDINWHPISTVNRNLNEVLLSDGKVIEVCTWGECDINVWKIDDVDKARRSDYFGNIRVNWWISLKGPTSYEAAFLIDFIPLYWANMNLPNS